MNQMVKNNNQRPSLSTAGTPNRTIQKANINQDYSEKEIELIFQPSHFTEIEVLITRARTSDDIPPTVIEKTMEDLFSFLENQEILEQPINMSYGSTVEERSGSETPYDSYYFESQRGVDVMTIEGKNITESSIIGTAQDLVHELKYKNIL